jgi:hypothetical protein
MELLRDFCNCQTQTASPAELGGLPFLLGHAETTRHDRQHEPQCKCSDNAPVQRFFSSLKREWTGEQVIADVPQYVAMYYNSKRLHPTIGYTKPMANETTLNKVSGIA